MAKSSRVYDELLCFLGDPIFQIPVRTYMDENCLIFDPSIEPSREHNAVHSRYKKLIDTLLESFCEDAKITVDEAVKGLNKMSEIPDLREVFSVLFEQVYAANDFNIFCQVMTKRNIMIQEQVLIMIMAATGVVPESLQPLRGGDKKSQAPPSSVPVHDKQEEEELKQIMQQSKKEHDTMEKQKSRESEQMKKTMELSKQEAIHLQNNRKQLEEDLSRLTLASAPSVAVSSSKKAPPPAKKAPSVPEPAVYAAKPKDISSADAASQWMKSAQAEAATSSATHSAMAASLSQLSPDELKKRQDFLKGQRDKLLAMKKETRAKQLGAAETAQPQRPCSARAARSAMGRSGQAAPSSSAEDEKRLAMRKAIANKLKQEVIASGGNVYGGKN